MSAHAKQALNEEGYLALEREAETKSEFFDGAMVAMAGAKAAHNSIAFNVSGAIWDRLADSCRGFSSDMKVRVPEGREFYPDLVVVCGEAKYLDEREDVLLNPVLIVEVLSTSTEAFDRGRKFELYRTIPSLKAYVLIAQDRVQVDAYTRQNDDRWLLSSASRIEDTIELEPIGCRVALADFYRKVRLP